MPSRKLSSFSYYFLNKRLHPSAPAGFRASLILFIVNHNSGRNAGKFLFVREISGGYVSWGLPKEGLESPIVVDDIFTALTRNLEEELGFRGMNINELKPIFYQKALLFDFALQKYDRARSVHEATRKRPIKGKIYHLAIMEYHGPEEIPGDFDSNKSEIDAFRWTFLEEGKKLIEESSRTFNPSSAEFNADLLEKIVKMHQDLERHFTSQPSLF